MSRGLYLSKAHAVRQQGQWAARGHRSGELGREPRIDELRGGGLAVRWSSLGALSRAAAAWARRWRSGAGARRDSSWARCPRQMRQ